MSTATIETDRLVSQPQREVIYTARRSDLRLVMTPRYPILNALGAKTGTDTQGVTVQFIAGMLRLPTSGDVETEHGVKVPAEELLAWLEKHRLNGDRFEGFFLLEQTAPPLSGDELRNLLTLQRNFDVEGLEAFIEQERAGWNRDDVLLNAQETLDGVVALQAEAVAQAKAKPKG